MHDLECASEYPLLQLLKTSKTFITYCAHPADSILGQKTLVTTNANNGLHVCVARVCLRLKAKSALTTRWNDLSGLEDYAHCFRWIEFSIWITILLITPNNGDVTGFRASSFMGPWP